MQSLLAFVYWAAFFLGNLNLIASSSSPRFFRTPQVTWVSAGLEKTCFLTNEVGLNVYCFGTKNLGSNRIYVGDNAGEILNGLVPLSGVCHSTYVVTNEMYEGVGVSGCAIDGNRRTFCWDSTNVNPIQYFFSNGSSLFSKYVTMGLYNGQSGLASSVCAIGVDSKLYGFNGYVVSIGGFTSAPVEIRFSNNAEFLVTDVAIGNWEYAGGGSYFGHQAAVHVSGALYVWGFFINSGFGNVPSQPVQSAPRTLQNSASAVKVSCGNRFCCVLDSNQNVQCFGNIDARNYGARGKI